MDIKKMKPLKYLCLFVLGFCIGLYCGRAGAQVQPDYEVTYHGHKILGPFAEETLCLAKNLYFEAGNQPLAGKIAVGQVTLNRVGHEKFPSSICAVVYQTKEYKKSWKTGEKIPRRGMCQFSWFCDGKDDTPKDSVTFEKCMIIARQIQNGEFGDITEGALWYHADYIKPYWSMNLNKTVHIDQHIFYK
jgi:spore germination cell wall hydrolase CwlJ-like protein